MKHSERLLFAVSLALSMVACGDEQQTHEAAVSEDQDQPVIDRSLTAQDIDPEIYFDFDDEEDPFRGFYEAFRERRTADMNDPEKPGPIESYQPVHLSADRSWSNLEDIFPFDWSGLEAESPAAVAQLKSTVKASLAFDHPDIKIVQLLLGFGAILPMHAEGSPGIYIVIEGSGEVSVEGVLAPVTMGSTVRLSPYDQRRIVAAPDAPLKIIWIRWAPGGDQRYLSAGYYLTGANQHIQPRDAALPADYSFWPAKGASSPASVDGVAKEAVPLSAFVEGQIVALNQARAALGAKRDLYPKVPVFLSDRDLNWLDQETLEKANFFWAKDVQKLGALLTRWSEVMLYKGFFQAARPDGGWDFNISQMVWGPHARYVEHSHSIPEFYYMLSGPVEHWVGETKYLARPGDIFLTNSYVPHQSRGIVDNLPFRSIGASWAPNGDRSVFTRPFYLIEGLPAQSENAVLSADVSFH